MNRKPRALFIGGSINQTSQLFKVSQHLADFDCAFSPYYTDGILDWAHRTGLVDFTIAGNTWAAKTRDWVLARGGKIDDHGREGPYDLVLTAQDVIVPKNVRGLPMVLIQEGMTDSEDELGYRLYRAMPFLPRWVSGTAATGLSDAYDRFCVASEGYVEKFAGKGVRREKLVATGMPNFDDCKAYEKNDFPRRGYVLVCTSDARECMKFEDRKGFLRKAQALAAGRPVIFKLHPNGIVARATREIREMFPDAPIFDSGCAEEMVANCDALIVQYSTLAYVGLALGKEVHSYFDLDDLRRLMPDQHGRAAEKIARVCREVVAARIPELAAQVLGGAPAATGAVAS